MIFLHSTILVMRRGLRCCSMAPEAIRSCRRKTETPRTTWPTEKSTSAPSKSVAVHRLLMTAGVFRAADSGRAIVVLHGIRSCVESEDERDHEREAREEEHEERGFTQAGCCNTGDDVFVSDARIREQHPEIADRHGQIPERHDHALHRRGCLTVGELESGGGHEYFAEGEECVRQHLPYDRHRIAAVQRELNGA